MEIHFLASGSKGNSCIIKSGSTVLMIDCGLIKRDLLSALGELQEVSGIAPGDIHRILLTHEHGDHIIGVPVMQRKWNTMCSASYKTQCATPGIRWAGFIPTDKSSPIGEFSLEAFPVSHDAADPVGFIFDDGTHRHAHLPDMGYCSEYVASRLVNLDSIAIECNYNEEMLECRTDIAESVRQRTRSNTGHMSDEMAATVAGIASEQSEGRLKTVILQHLSDHSITPEIAIQTMLEFNPGARFMTLIAKQLSIVSVKLIPEPVEA